jgi:uncharacterized repeat protein (TIGR03803 family)
VPRAAAQRVNSAKLSTLHSFLGGTDGAEPVSVLVDVGGTLYGTTVAGGGNSCSGGQGCGTVFAINPATGAENIVYRFHGGTDGSAPMGAPLSAGGFLYGTTEIGGGTGCGLAGCGTIYAVNPATGAENVVHKFTDFGDGVDPIAGLIMVGPTLYGTTMGGGKHQRGTVFAFTPDTGTETVLHSFSGNTDGEFPDAALLDVDGTLYGTAAFGGGSGCGGFGCGIVFAINQATGAEAVVHRFIGSADGGKPSAALINVGGALYGTTEEGGGASCGGSGCGTVFAINPATGAETVVHSFAGNPDGASPNSALVDVGGTLYGTTSIGGNNGRKGHGTVFAIDPATGAETVVYNFSGGTSTVNPEGLVELGALLYGTTLGGGAAGVGTIFKLSI